MRHEPFGPTLTGFQAEFLGNRRDYLGLDVVDGKRPDGTPERPADWSALMAAALPRTRFVTVCGTTGPHRVWFEDAQPLVEIVEDEFGITAGAVLEVTALDHPLIMVTGWVGVWTESLTPEQLLYFADLRLPGVRLVEYDRWTFAGRPRTGLRFVPRPLAHPRRMKPFRPGPESETIAAITATYERAMKGPAPPPGPVLRPEPAPLAPTGTTGP